MKGARGNKKVALEPVAEQPTPQPIMMSSENPLENTVILANVFKFCKAKQLANCRLVCKRWHGESLARWRKISPVTITKESNGRSDFAFQSKSGDGQTSTSPVDYVKNPANQCAIKPFGNITISDCTLFIALSEYGNLFDAIGTTLTTLRLVNCDIFCKDNDPVLKTVCMGCPNLCDLKLDNLIRVLGGDDQPVAFAFGEKEYREPPYGKHLRLTSLHVTWNTTNFKRPTNWMNLLSTFQSLKKLSVKQEPDHVTIIDSIRAVRAQDSKALPLERISIEGLVIDMSEGGDERSMEMARHVLQLRLPLASFLINIKSQADEVRLREYLAFISISMKILKIRASPSSTISFIQPFPFGQKLYNLKSLEITEEFCGGSLEFLQYTPNLQRLAVNVRGSRKQLIYNSRISSKQLRMNKLRELSLESNLKVSDKDIDCLYQCMPELISLHGISVSDRQFGTVCGKWRRLKYLTVCGDELSDAGITGIDRREENRNARRRPNITYLKDLEVFSFRTDELTDVSVFDGFLKLQKLQTIRCHSSIVGWGPEATAALRRNNIRVTTI